MNHRRPSLDPSRRHFLRGVGVALALPWLESLPWAGASAAAAGLPAGAAQAAAKAGPPLRLGIVFFSNGVEPAHWWAKGSGATMELGPGLTPMLPHREDMVFIRGLYSQSALVSTSPHLGRMNLLSGASMIYGSSLSWVSPSKPATKEIYPSRAFDRLVGDGTGRALDRSILDAVQSESAGLKPRISRDDHHKLNEYFEGIRDIEKRIERASKEERLEGWRPSIDKPDMPRPKNELPQNVPDHMKLMLDLIVLAFQMDKTRVATLMLNNDLSQMNFKFIEGVQGALHLDLTHNGHVADKEAMYLKTNQFHIQQFAYLTERMKNITEGETSLLDNSILFGASSLFDGDLHGADQLPILITGKGGGTIKGGRILDYLEKGDANRKVCSLHLSLMDRMGVKLDGFGDATTRLTEL
jgi:Protein of unknown function (DUF1552)